MRVCQKHECYFKIVVINWVNKYAHIASMKTIDWGKKVKDKDKAENAKTVFQLAFYC